MITWFDVLAVLFALALAAIGFWRGLHREILVSLAGIALGVFTGWLWATSWGAAWGARVGVSPQVFQGIIALVSLYLVVLLLGYGSALFLRRRPLSLGLRVAGAAVGLINGLFLAAFTFSYIQSYFLGDPPPTNSVLMTSLVASAMIRWPPVVLAVIVGGLGLTVVVIAFVRLGRWIFRLVQEQPAAAPGVEPAAGAPAEPAAPSPTPAAGPTIPCPNCGQPVPVGTAYCPHCGKTISS